MSQPADPPACTCHGEPTAWHKDPRRRTGGYWQCRIARVESDRRYDRSPKGRARTARDNALPQRRLDKQLYELSRVSVRVRY